MNSIDLIPADYRNGIKREHRMRTILWVVSGTCVLVLLASYWVSGLSKQVNAQTQQLRTDLALTELHKEQLARMDSRLTALNEEWMLLRGLRSGASAEDLFVIVDKALPDENVWFYQWSFRRAGVVTAKAPQSVDTGYFLVVTEGTNTDAFDEWQVETHMSITGQAKDHAALSQFVRGLYRQREIQEVKLDETRVVQYANASVIDFKLAVVLHSEPAI